MTLRQKGDDRNHEAGRAPVGRPPTGTEVVSPTGMADIRFDSIEDAELADIWYALSGAAIRHPDHFKPLTDAVFTELLDRRGVGLNPFLEQRFREFRQADSREDAAANRGTDPATPQ